MYKLTALILSLLTFSIIFLSTTSPIFAACDTALQKSGVPNQIDTGIGCIPTSAQGLATVVLTIGSRIAGGIAILLIIIGGFKVALSQGDPDALQSGRDMITSAVIGLVFILLATVILGIIGIDILGISFFSRDPGTGAVNINP